MFRNANPISSAAAPSRPSMFGGASAFGQSPAGRRRRPASMSPPRPGVAFDYRYAFRLPGNRISQAQEAHAQACEKLGIDRCRITGMRYRLVNQKDVEAMLALRLDPSSRASSARMRPRSSTKADGMLVDQQITGDDVGTRSTAPTAAAAELRDELRRVEAELARPVPMIRERRPASGGRSPEPPRSRAGNPRAVARARRKQGIRQAGARRHADGVQLRLGQRRPGLRRPLAAPRRAPAGGRQFRRRVRLSCVVLVTLLPWLLIAGLAVWALRRARAAGRLRLRLRRRPMAR